LDTAPEPTDGALHDSELPEPVQVPAAALEEPLEEDDFDDAALAAAAAWKILLAWFHMW
jgi:hypothetical protein